MAPVKFSTMMVTVSAVTLVPTMASQAKVRFDSICTMPPIQRLVASGTARTSEPPANPPISAAARPTPLTTAA